MPFDFKAKVVTFNGYGPDKYQGTGVTGPDDPGYSKRILCEGDSWFSIGGLPGSNLLFHMHFNQSTLLINLARPGDTIKNISKISENPKLSELIYEKKFLTKWDAIFLSGGGNDLIDMSNQIICTPSEGAGKHMLDYVDSVELNNLKNRVQRGYSTIARLRVGSKNEKTPIITHVYDYPTPRNAKSKFGAINVGGPWIYAALKTNDVPEEFWISLTDYIFEYLAVSIIELENKIENFHVVASTRGTLRRARLGTRGPDGDWENEIHPTSEGYEKLANIISEHLSNLFI